VNFDLDESTESFRDEVIAFLEAHVTAETRLRARITGTRHDWELHRALAERGWLGAGWPVEYGGQGRDPLEMGVLRDEMKRRHVPVDGMGITLMVSHVILHAGTEAMKHEIIPGALNGELLICLGYTEPQGGSDVAGARTSAVRDGESWIINGQKMFTTLAHESDYVFLLTRTDSDLPKHRGLTMFLVPLDTPGVEIHPVHTIGGVRTNATFYTDVVVPDSARVGDVNDGWSVMLLALTYERSSGGEDVALLDAAVSAARTAVDVDGGCLLDVDSVRERLARIAIEREVAKLLGRRSQWIEAQGGVPSIEGSMHKLFSDETTVRAASDLIDIFGAEGALEYDEEDAPAGGDFSEEFRHSIVLPIYGGSSEVQRRIIAERHLGLPRGH
jgi:alkylation response protein AidB-like acyl-CoA dehydrogenase